MMNPCDFKTGDIIEDFYTKDHYKVVEPDKRGMAILYNLSTRKNEDWNAENNFRFTKLEGQLELF
nr:hypothetical protein [uncultured Prevotella sp.]